MRHALPAVLLLCIFAPQAAAQARIVRLPSAIHGGAERIAAVLLPPGYADSEKRFPVLYLLHGGGQDHTAFMARAAFPRTARRNEMIVVMPAADRTIGARGADALARYETFLATELVPYVDEHYRTVAAEQGRAIGGISQGGGFAASTALRYPGVFGAVGALSPAFRGAAADTAGEVVSTHFYVSCGTADSLLPASRELVALLERRKIPHEYREIAGGEHTWAVWDAELAVFIERLAARGGWRVPAAP